VLDSAMKVGLDSALLVVMGSVVESAMKVGLESAL